MIEWITNALDSAATILKGYDENRRAKTQAEQEAFGRLLAAIMTTQSYIYDCQQNQSAKSRALEKEISRLWVDAAQKLYGIDDQLMDRCLIKADCWSDPRLWDAPEYKSVPLSLASMKLSCQALVRDHQ